MTSRGLLNLCTSAIRLLRSLSSSPFFPVLVNHWIAVLFYAEKLAFVVDLDNQCKVNRPWFINLTDTEDLSASLTQIQWVYIYTWACRKSKLFSSLCTQFLFLKSPKVYVVQSLHPGKKKEQFKEVIKSPKLWRSSTMSGCKLLAVIVCVPTCSLWSHVPSWQAWKWHAPFTLPNLIFMSGRKN